MKVKQFLNKMLYASSSIKTVEVVSRNPAGQKCSVVLNDVELRDPMDQHHTHFVELESTLTSFAINGDTMRVYAQ